MVWCSQCSYKTTRIASKLHTQNSCIKPDATSGNKFEFPFTQWWMCKHNMETNSDRLVDGKQVPTGMHPDLVQTGYYRFLLTSCLTQDTLENLFSQICGCGDSHPTPVKLRHNIWLISISQFAKTPKNGSYDSADDVHFAIPLLHSKSNVDNSHHVSDFVETNMDIDALCSDGSAVSGACEHNALAYLAGWIAFKLWRLHHLACMPWCRWWQLCYRVVFCSLHSSNHMVVLTMD